jgi:hypothetical protein
LSLSRTRAIIYVVFAFKDICRLVLRRLLWADGASTFCGAPGRSHAEDICRQEDCEETV